MFTNESCTRCGHKIPEEELKPEPNYWDCPKCKNRNYKYYSSGWLGLGNEKGPVKEAWIEQSRIDTIGNKVKLYNREKEIVHEVKDKEGKIIHRDIKKKK